MLSVGQRHRGGAFIGTTAVPLERFVFRPRRIDSSTDGAVCLTRTVAASTSQREPFGFSQPYGLFRNQPM
jgi:hypothetical protein